MDAITRKRIQQAARSGNAEQLAQAVRAAPYTPYGEIAEAVKHTPVKAGLHSLALGNVEIIDLYGQPHVRHKRTW